VVITVDWSAANRPTIGADSIWVYEWPAATLTNVATRATAARVVLDTIRAHGNSRVLVACDVSFGYPAGTAAAAGLMDHADAPQPWLAMWRHLAAELTDTDGNVNNRFHVAAELNRRFGRPRFWGAPPAAESEWLPRTKPPIERPLREVEQRYRAVGLYPASCWQLLGAGSVGSQSLTAIPVLYRWRQALAGRCTVWPFEQLTGASDEVVLAEVWPSELPAAEIAAVEHPVKDARQVIALAHRLSCGVMLPALDDVDAACINEEGWVLSTML
jgi:hypothetical protein